LTDGKCAYSRQTCRQKGKTDKQTDRQIGRPTDRQERDRHAWGCMQADRQADWMREGDRHADGDACRQEAVRQVGRPAFRQETQAGRWGCMQAGSRHRQAGR
jgi:hypothetical protein